MIERRPSVLLDQFARAHHRGDAEAADQGTLKLPGDASDLGRRLPNGQKEKLLARRLLPGMKFLDFAIEAPIRLCRQRLREGPVYEGVLQQLGELRQEGRLSVPGAAGGADLPHGAVDASRCVPGSCPAATRRPPPRRSPLRRRVRSASRVPSLSPCCPPGVLWPPEDSSLLGHRPGVESGDARRVPGALPVRWRRSLPLHPPSCCPAATGPPRPIRGLFPGIPPPRPRAALTRTDAHGSTRILN
jgi:hypothetical protein